jgi:hypothetical protein
MERKETAKKGTFPEKITLKSAGLEPLLEPSMEPQY